jgi:hypothetical protein
LFAGSTTGLAAGPYECCPGLLVIFHCQLDVSTFVVQMCKTIINGNRLINQRQSRIHVVRVFRCLRLIDQFTHAMQFSL